MLVLPKKRIDIRIYKSKNHQKYRITITSARLKRQNQKISKQHLQQSPSGLLQISDHANLLLQG
jgi:hypothetical protein